MTRKKLNQRLQATCAALALVAISATAGGPPSAPQFAPATAAKSTASHSTLAGPLDSERSFNRLIIKFKTPATTRAGVFDFRAAEDKVSTLSANAQARNADAAGLSQLKSISAQTQVALTDTAMTRGELLALAKQLEQDPSVEYAEIDELNYPQFAPNDSGYTASQWHYQAPSGPDLGGANLPVAWDRTTGAGVVVAVIDTGYLDHNDLDGQILPGYDFITDPAMANDGGGRDADAHDPGDWTAANFCYSGAGATKSSWHGTHVAGTIAALTNNAIGGAGVAFNAKILPVRVLGRCGGYISDIAAGMRWAAGLNVPGVTDNPVPNKAKVLNLSLGGTGACGSTYQDAVNEVRGAGSVVVAATGNDKNFTRIGRPANCAGVIAVTAHTRSGDHADYGNAGAGTTISAPGGGAGEVNTADTGLVYSTLNAGTTIPDADKNRYGIYQGTSMATPHVAGVVALLASLKPAITPDAVAAILTNSARVHPPGTYCAGLADPTVCGAGLLDGAAAVALLLDSPNPSAYTAGGFKATGSTVTLTGQAFASNVSGFPIVSYLWTQLSGPAVALSNGTTSSASFVAPVGSGKFSFALTVTDSDGKTATARTYVQSNTAPVLTPATVVNQNLMVGQTLSFKVQATDAEGDPVGYMYSGLPFGATLDSATGQFTWNNAGPAGTHNVTVTPTDGIFDGLPKTVAITIASAPAPAPAATGGGGGGALNAWDLLALLALLSVSWSAARRRTPQ